MFAKQRRKLKSLYAGILGNAASLIENCHLENLHKDVTMSRPNAGIVRNFSAKITGVSILEFACVVNPLYTTGYNKVYKDSRAQLHFFSRYFFGKHKSLYFLTEFIATGMLPGFITESGNYSPAIAGRLELVALEQWKSLHQPNYRLRVLARMRCVLKVLELYA